MKITLRSLNLIVLLCLSIVPYWAIAQTDSILVQGIIIQGNKRTKSQIILRESIIKQNTKIAISDTAFYASKSQNYIFNTGLFNYVDVHYLSIDQNSVIVEIEVIESWYIFPIPTFELADRNFTEFKERGGFKNKRYVYGIYFVHNNFRGRNEKLKILLQTGFYNKYEFFYSVPYISKNQKWGIKFGVSYSENKQVAFESLEHKLHYLKTDHILRKRIYTQFSTSYKPKFNITHTLDFYAKNNSIQDTISILNPNYFGNGKNQLNYLEFDYSFRFNNTDKSYYPEKGILAIVNLEKIGVKPIDEINQLNINLNLEYYKDLSKHFFIATKSSGKISTPINQTYFTTKALGYNTEFLRGYERYVIDGSQYLLGKTDFKYKFVDHDFILGNIENAKQVSKIPLRLYAKVFFDYGYVYQKNTFNLNFLDNELIYSTGVGIDWVTYYDFVFMFEYTLNSQKNHGFYLNIGKSL